MGRSIAVLLLASVLLLSFTSLLNAYSKKTLTREDIQTAIAYGKSRRGQTIVERGHPNYVSFDNDDFSRASGAFVSTPWLELATAAQDAANKYQELSQVEIQRILRQSTGRLTIGAWIMASTEDFWRDPHSVIRQDTVTIQPVSKLGRFINVVNCDTHPCLVGAGFSFIFLDDQLNASKPATLIIILLNGHKEFRASLNLAAMR